MKRWSTLVFSTTVVLLEFATVAAAHGDEIANKTTTEMSSSSDKPHPPPTSYMRHPEHVTLILAHIALMVVGWVFALPVGKPATAQESHGCVVD
jgi:hypothetical protein